MKVYEVTIRSGRTDTFRLLADSVLDISTMYDNLSDADIVQIKEVVYVNVLPTISNVLYNRELKVLVSNGIKNQFFNFKFVKNILNKEKVINLLKTYLLINNKKVNTIHSLTIWN